MNMLYIIITESNSNHYERKKSSFHSACRCGNELYVIKTAYLYFLYLEEQIKYIVN